MLVKEILYILFILLTVIVIREWTVAIPVLGVISLVWTWSLWKRWILIQDAPAPAQVRFSMQGFGERMGIGTVKLNPWRITQQFEVTRIESNRIHVRLGDPDFSKLPGRGIDIQFESRADPEAWAAVLREFRDRGLRAYCGVNAEPIDE